MLDPLDLITSVSMIEDAADMAGKIKDDPPKEKKWRKIATVLMFIVAFGVFLVSLLTFFSN